MKTYFRVITFLFLIGTFFIQSAFSQISSLAVDAGEIDPSSDGFFYSLPLNLVRVDVTVLKVEEYKGKFSDQASKLLGISDVINRDKTSYRIKNVELSTETMIDTLHIYYAKLPAKWNDKYSFELSLSESGLISAYKQVEKSIDANYNDGSKARAFRDLMKPVLIEKVDTIIRKVSIDTTTFEEKILKRSISEKSIEQQAREIADLIYRIEDNKFSLITGYQEVNYSKESLKFMIDNLNKMEQEYLAYFKGSKVTTEEVFTFYYTPNVNDREIFRTLFRFSEQEGITGRDNRSGDPVSISSVTSSGLTKIKSVENKRLQLKKKAKGIIYRIPEEVNYTIHIGNKELASQNLFISQLGVLTFLPSLNLGHAEFHENGALKTIILR